MTSLIQKKRLSKYPLPTDMLAASKEEIVEIIRKTARFGEKSAFAKYDAILAAAKDSQLFGRTLSQDQTLHRNLPAISDTSGRHPGRASQGCGSVAGNAGL